MERPGKLLIEGLNGEEIEHLRYDTDNDRILVELKTGITIFIEIESDDEDSTLIISRGVRIGK